MNFHRGGGGSAPNFLWTYDDFADVYETVYKCFPGCNIFRRALASNWKELEVAEDPRLVRRLVRLACTLCVLCSFIFSKFDRFFLRHPPIPVPLHLDRLLANKGAEDPAKVLTEMTAKYLLWTRSGRVGIHDSVSRGLWSSFG